jgi:hypothetical protein
LDGLPCRGRVAGGDLLIGDRRDALVADRPGDDDEDEADHCQGRDLASDGEPHGGPLFSDGNGPSRPTKAHSG